MNRDEILGLLQEHKATLAQRFGVSTLTLFGSVARDQVKDNSDVDILVSFDGPDSLAAIFRRSVLPGGPAGTSGRSCHR